MHYYFREIPQIYHTFALFDPPQIGNLMIPFIVKHVSKPKKKTRPQNPRWISKHETKKFASSGPIPGSVDLAIPSSLPRSEGMGIMEHLRGLSGPPPPPSMPRKTHRK